MNKKENPLCQLAKGIFARLLFSHTVEHIATQDVYKRQDQYLSDPEHYQLDPWILEETKKVSHRAYCTGFYFGPIENGQYYENAGYIRTYDVVAIVDGYREGRLLCTQRKMCIRDSCPS